MKNFLATKNTKSSPANGACKAPIGAWLTFVGEAAGIFGFFVASCLGPGCGVP